MWDEFFSSEDYSPVNYYPGTSADLYGGSADLYVPSVQYDLSQLPSADYSNEGRNYPTTESTQGAGGSPINATTTAGKDFDFLDFLKSIGTKGLNYVSNNPGQVGLMAALAALGALSKAPPSGGGTTKRYVGPAQQLTRTITQGKYGPIAQYAAQGGIMHAYAHGGQVKPVAMEDGGFVMTKRAVDGAGGPQGIQALLPGARPIRGPGTGTSDSIPAYIQGRSGVTPAKVSNGEAYIPRRAQPPGGTRELYAMMRQLERRA